MSHSVKIQTQFKDLSILKATFKKLGWEIKENSRMKSYHNNDGRVYPLVAVNPNGYGYDIGLIPNDNEIETVTDLYGGSVEASLGRGLCKLKQGYAQGVIESSLEPLGFMINTTTMPNGVIQIEAEKL